ncbi:lysylphosphatidylglycerol synthase domain-containing protein [Niabella terrae]
MLFAWLSWSIYNQVRHQPDLHASWREIKQSFSSPKCLYLVAVVALMVLNLGLEAYKWKIAVGHIQKIRFPTAFKAVLSGLSFSISTPNRVGEYLGRVLYMKEGNRIKAVALTILGSMSQLIVTVFMGLLALFFLKPELVNSGMISPVWVRAAFFATAIGLVIMLLFYFKLSWLVKVVDKLPQMKRLSWTIEALEQVNATLLVRFLSLSVTRFLVFTLQYYILFRFFGVEIGFVQAWSGISVMFLALAVIPTIALFTDLGLKNEISIKVIGLFSSNHLGIGLTSLTIWLVNLVIPALIGSLLILSIKNILKGKHENN